MLSAAGNDDDYPFNIIGGSKKISIIGNSTMSLWFIGTFCTNFLSYQLETWQMLADNNDNNNNSVQMKTSSTYRTATTKQDVQLRQDLEGAHLVLARENFGGAQTSGGARRSTKLFSNTMRTGSIDDGQQASAHTRPVGRIWRRPEYSIQATTGAEVVAANTDDERNQLNNPIEFEPSRLGLSSGEQIPSQFTSNRYTKSHRSYTQFQNPQAPGFSSSSGNRGVQGHSGATSLNSWPQTSMDEHSEYLLSSRHSRSDQTSASANNYHAPANNYNTSANYISCHRARNASYSSTRTPNNTSSMQPLDLGVHHLQNQHSQTSNILMSAQKLPLAHCSPSSSGSLPAGLQLCNRHSCSESLDVSLEEPASLPLLLPAAQDMRPRQATTTTTLSGHGHRAPKVDQRATSQIYCQPATDTMGLGGGYYWRREDAGETTATNQGPGGWQGHFNNKTVFGRQIFKHSIYSHPNAVGSDSELYSHKQQIDRRNEMMMTTTTHNNRTQTNRPHLVGQSSIAVSDRTSDRSLRKSDTFRLASRQAEATTYLSQLQRANTTVNSNQQTTMDTKFKATSSSNNRLSLAGTIRRLGFKQKGLPSLSVQRSEEVVPITENCHYIARFGASSSFADSRYDNGSLWFSQIQQQQQAQRFGSESIDPRASFVDGLGPGQIASRQALVSPYLGDIQLTLNDRRGMLEVEIVRARGLQLKVGTKSLPCPYVKLYLMKNKKCLAKSKTSPARRTLDPLYQQQFIFREDYTNCILQLIVWGDYGKKDRKSLMGIVQIRIDDLDISNLVIGWYRMFNAPSMTHSLVSSKALRHQLLSRAVDTD